MRRFLGLSILFLLLALIVLPAIGCGEDDCSGSGANCALIVAGDEPACCEGLRCQDQSGTCIGCPQVCR